MKCLGRNQEDHCCYLNGKPCKYIKENIQPGYRWSCGLRHELGSWDAVLEDPRYIEDVHPEFIIRAERIGVPVTNCRDWPSDGEKCFQCGANV